MENLLGKGYIKSACKAQIFLKVNEAASESFPISVDKNKKVRLLTIYAKPKKSSISDKEIMLILQKELLL